jgi:Peptidase propeptide and YPEB domain
MTTKETKTRIANKKVLLPVVVGAIVASVILAGIFIAYPAISSVYAVQPFNTNTPAGMALGSNQIPNIVGSIKVVQTTKDVIKDNLKVTFSQAADIAGKQITNGTVIGGHLGVVQGYLVYTFFGVNPETHTAYHTIIDAGNGKVLYTSPGQQMDGGGFFGRLGPHGLAGGFGHGPFGFGFGLGPWSVSGGFTGRDGIWH